MTAFDLSGRVSVITGASAGIGAALARRLAARGSRLVLGARRLDRVAALAEELGASAGVEVRGLALDVTDRGSVDAFAREAHHFAGGEGVHLLVNNAGLARGVARMPTATEADEDDWEVVLDTNVMGLLRVTRRFVPAMVERGAGHVVNLGSLAALQPYEGGAAYCASKAAVRSISRILRLELLGTGVRVHCIHPGMVETEFSVVRLGSEEAAAAVYADMTPLRADDVARVLESVIVEPAYSNIEELTLCPTDQGSVRRVVRRPADKQETS